MLTDFLLIAQSYSMKFATKSLLYISAHFKGVTPLPCKHKTTTLA